MSIKIRSLSRSQDFKNLINGKKLTCKYVIIFFNKLDSENSKKLNISFITKKKLGNAVVRNKIKRRLRNIILEVVKTSNINYKYSYLFIAKKNVFEDDYEVIKEQIIHDIKKIK